MLLHQPEVAIADVGDVSAEPARSQLARGTQAFEGGPHVSPDDAIATVSMQRYFEEMVVCIERRVGDPVAHRLDPFGNGSSLEWIWTAVEIRKPEPGGSTAIERADSFQHTVTAFYRTDERVRTDLGAGGVLVGVISELVARR